MNATTLPLIDEIAEMLNSSIGDVFSTMFQMSVLPAAVTGFSDDGEMLIAGSVGFVGEINGMVYIYVKAPFAKSLAARMLGIDAAEVEGDEMVNDVIGEFSNMIVGSVKSRLCDTGASCKLTIPSIVRGLQLRADPTGSSEQRLISFTCEGEQLLVEVLMKPST